ncbi:hypothetical protein RSOL_391750 [Rhizoctonia solani AG-3 Rhs1AP]|uniref:Uncharacterized protein n=1 Tax=Rhizoctonia solani AG-3 Rhs1AP TaxID=1086054 RepID=X8JCH2_9AGAM|nr:hypothetical protein RSOL_391750 [Rhizoctonia solani AG-3 Rhs1AP]
MPRNTFCGINFIHHHYVATSYFHFFRKER